MELTASVIAGFVGSVLAPRFDEPSPSPKWHHEAWELCCSPHPRIAIASPRAHAKTSAITIGYGLSALLFRQRRHLLIISDTEGQANQFLGGLKNELANNEILIDLFGLKRRQNGEVDFIVDNESELICEFADGHRFRIIAKGAEQKMRGSLWDGLRPDLVICDDMENDEAVMNKERRQKLREWFFKAVIPSISKNGIIRFVGTILHTDSLLNQLMPENQLIGNARKTDLIVEELKTYTNRRTPWKSVKYKAHNEDFSAILWGERYDQAFFETKYQEAALLGLTDAYSQEWLNEPLDFKNSMFKKADLLPMTTEDQDRLVNYYLTVDLAISEKDRSDYSVFMVSAVDSDKKIYIVDVIRERMDGLEIVDTLLNLQRIYDFEVVGIEEMQVSKAIGPFLNERMLAENTFLNLKKLKHGGKDKIQRCRGIQARLRAHTIKFDKGADWYPVFEDELLKFPRDKHDD